MTSHALRIGRISVFLFILLLGLGNSAAARTGERLNRGGYLQVSNRPVLYESNLWQTSYRGSLQALFDKKTREFAERLAAGLEKTAFRGRLLVLENSSDDGKDKLSKQIKPDKFLVTVDLRTRYGLADSAPLMACLSAASCFLLSPFNLFNYTAESEALVNGFYLDPDGRKIRLVQKRYQVVKEISGNFFEANSLQQEVSWIDELTGQVLYDFRGKILADLPAELVERSWRQAADALNQPPADGFSTLPPPPPQGEAKVQKTEKKTRTDRKLPGKPLDLQNLVRRAAPAVFKIRVGDRTGSGFAISERGYGITSLTHLGEAETFHIKFHNGRELNARVLLTEEELDLAVIAFLPGEAEPLSLGDSDSLSEGDQLVAVGYPLEQGLSVVPTEISGIDLHRSPPLFELSADLDLGNAGGPLLNDWGEVVGILVLPRDAKDPSHPYLLPINEASRAFFHLLD